MGSSSFVLGQRIYAISVLTTYLAVLEYRVTKSDGLRVGEIISMLQFYSIFDAMGRYYFDLICNFPAVSSVLLVMK